MKHTIPTMSNRLMKPATAYKYMLLSLSSGLGVGGTGVGVTLLIGS